MKKIVTFGEIMLRLSPPNYQIIEDASHYEATYGGTEANVAISLSGFNHDASFVTKLPDNQLGEGALKYLKANNVLTNHIKLNGDNIGIYFLETGFGIRPSKVLYNRKHSTFTTIKDEDIDIDAMLKDADWFHFSGITLALHDNVRKVLFKILEKAKEKGITISFDCNYRQSLWTLREASVIYQKIAPFIDVFFASAFDCRELFGIKGDFNNPFDYLVKLKNDFKAKYVFGYQRTIHSATENELKGYVVTHDQVIETDSIRFTIFDRIGSGDAFAAGVIHGLLKTEDERFALNFGISACALKHTLWGDAFKLNESDVMNFLESKSKEVKR